MDKLNPQAAQQLQALIAHLLDKPVDLTITDNTHSMIYIRPSRSSYNVRLHHMFLKANEQVLSSLANYVRSRSRKAPSVLRDFIAANGDKIRTGFPKPRRGLLRHLGKYFNLKEIFLQVNRDYFDNKVDCLITWGARRRVRQQNSIRLGSYSERTKTIRVNPALDRSYVPKYVIVGVVHHEMLHHFLGVESRNGRKIAHSKAFRQMESRYYHHHRLQVWKKKNLHRLLGR
jgi:hypothetical protein